MQLLELNGAKMKIIYASTWINQFRMFLFSAQLKGRWGK